MTIDHSTLSTTTLETLVKCFEEFELQIWLGQSRSDRYEMMLALRDMARQAEVNGEIVIAKRYEDVAKFIWDGGPHA